MIVSENAKPQTEQFKNLMAATDLLLNEDAQKRPSYYAKRNGSMLEDDVMQALIECSIGTPFQNTIIKISGQRFPDIVAAKFYGVEVKSTKDDHWTSTGSSILESTRVQGVERIYMTFGKLGGKVEFLSKPYEECLSGIAVTHSPRYLIDMRLQQGETIFDKLGIPYDTLRKMENPIAPVSQYYRSQLKDGESLWWAGDAADETVSATIKLWKNVDSEEKKHFVTYGCVHFPEIFAGNYDRYALWLTSQGVVDPHIRDQFSAGGQEPMQLSNGEVIKFPGVYRRIKINLDYFISLMEQSDKLHIKTPQSVEEFPKRLAVWCDLVAKYTDKSSEIIDYNTAIDALSVLFKRKS